jgi:hypothetical protein
MHNIGVVGRYGIIATRTFKAIAWLNRSVAGLKIKLLKDSKLVGHSIFELR